MREHNNRFESKRFIVVFLAQPYQQWGSLARKIWAQIHHFQDVESGGFFMMVDIYLFELEVLAGQSDVIQPYLAASAMYGG